MKNLLVSLFVLLVLSVSNPLYAQWAVADAPNLAQNVKNFSELQKQVSLLNEQKSRLDESLDLMRKVSTTISNSVTVKNIMERQLNLSNMCIEIVSKYELGPKSAQTLTTSIAQILANNRKMISLFKMILSPNVKMNDAERLNALTEVEKDMREEEKKLYKFSSLLNQYEQFQKLFE